MNKYPLERNEWYKLRDDRTRRIDGVSGFDNYSLGVIVNSAVRLSYSIQIMTLIALNMLARWCRKITVQIPSDTPAYLPYKMGHNFIKILDKMLSDIDPYGQFDFKNVNRDCNQILFIGQPEESIKLISDQYVWIDASGWIAGVGYENPTMYVKTNKDNNPIGPAFASCLGVAEIFRKAIGLSPLCSRSAWYSLYDFSRIESQNQLNNSNYVSDFDYGRIYQIGCGAVASSLDLLISLTRLKAEIYLIDYDQVDFTNLNRSFLIYDAITKKNKVDACANILKPSRMHPIPFKGSYTNFIKEGKLLDYPPDIILCLANERNVWADIQHNFPPIVFHATTTPNWGINLGRHIPKAEWCIMCRFSKEIEHKFSPVCGEVELKYNSSDEKPIQGVLPFLSTTAAVLLLAEMAKIPSDNYPINEDFVEFSMRNLDASFMKINRRAESGCICNEQSLDLYPKGIKRSKFWKLVK
jgi:hypothetical protein